jgi:hypothetical protein
MLINSTTKVENANITSFLNNYPKKEKPFLKVPALGDFELFCEKLRIEDLTIIKTRYCEFFPFSHKTNGVLALGSKSALKVQVVLNNEVLC